MTQQEMNDKIAAANKVITAITDFQITMLEDDENTMVNWNALDTVHDNMTGFVSMVIKQFKTDAL